MGLFVDDKICSYAKRNKMQVLSLDDKILQYAIKNDLILFGLEASKYCDLPLETFKRGICITIDNQVNKKDRRIDEIKKIEE